MGDSGSLTIGFIISILAVLSIKYIHPVTVLYFAAIPILDTLVVMIRRKRRGKSPFRADKTHLHHILVKFIGDENEEGNIINGTKRTVWFLVFLQVIFSSVGLLLSEYLLVHTYVAPFLALVGFGIVFVLTYVIFTTMKKKMGISL